MANKLSTVTKIQNPSIQTSGNTDLNIEILEANSLLNSPEISGTANKAISKIAATVIVNNPNVNTKIKPCVFNILTSVKHPNIRGTAKVIVAKLNAVTAVGGEASGSAQVYCNKTSANTSINTPNVVGVNGVDTMNIAANIQRPEVSGAAENEVDYLPLVTEINQPATTGTARFIVQTIVVTAAVNEPTISGECHINNVIRTMTSWMALPSIEATYGYNIQWLSGDTAYIGVQAEKGKLEKVVIENVEIPETSGVPYPVYKDTFNSLWGEDDLVSEEDALSIINSLRAWGDHPLPFVSDHGNMRIFPDKIILVMELQEPSPLQYERDVLYIKAKAEQGELEKVCVEKCVWQPENKNHVFRDTLNRLWLIEELISYEEAVALAEEYLNERMAIL